MRKKIFYLVLVLFLILNCCACTNKKNQLTNVNEFELTKATKVVDDYLNSYMENDYTSMNYMYSKGFKKKVENKNKPYLKVVGYKITDSTEMGLKANIKVNVVSTDTNSPYTSTDAYTFKIKKEKGGYVIDDISSSNEKEVFLYKRSLLVKIKDEPMSNVLVNLRGIPEYYFEKTDVANVNKVRVAKDSFNNLSLSYSADNVAVSTAGANPFVGICGITDLQQSTGDGGQGQNQGQGNNVSENDIDPSKVAAKSITAIDVYAGSKVEAMVFSRDEKLLAVQIAKAGNTTVNVYNIESGKLLSKEIEKTFPKDEVDLRIVRADEEDFLIESTPKAQYKNDNSVKKIVGRWEWNTKDYKIKKEKAK